MLAILTTGQDSYLPDEFESPSHIFKNIFLNQKFIGMNNRHYINTIKPGIDGPY